MRCKKIALVVAMFGGITLSGLSNAAVLSDTVTVNFIGTFQNTTCSINSDASGKESIDLTLGAYKSDEIKANADATKAIPFTVNLTGCGSINLAEISFNGTQTSSKLFDVQGGNKNNVGVGVNKSATAGDYIAIGDKTTVTITNGSGSVDFFARYVKIGDTPLVEGNANSVATMDITYL